MQMALHETFSIPLFLFVGFFFYSFHKVSFYSFHKVQAEKLEIKAVTNIFCAEREMLLSSCCLSSSFIVSYLHFYCLAIRTK